MGSSDIEARLDASRSSWLLDQNAFDVVEQMLDASPETIGLEDFGSYRIEARIDSGGMGGVWRAYDKTASRSVAIKIPHYAATTHLHQRFLREIKSLGGLEHRFIARLYDHGTLPSGTP